MKLTWFAVSHPRLSWSFWKQFCIILFVNLSLFWKNKKYKKKFYINQILRSTLRELVSFSTCKILCLNILITVDKTYEKVLRLKVEQNSNNKTKSRKVSFLVETPYNKTVIDFNFGRHKDYLPCFIPFNLICNTTNSHRVGGNIERWTQSRNCD